MEAQAGLTLATACPESRWSPRQLLVFRRVIIGAILVLYLAALPMRLLPSGDSALYRLLGDSIAQGHGYSLWGQPSAFVPPAYPLLLAGSERLGMPPVLLNLLTLSMTLAVVWLAYAILRYYLRPELALAATALYALCYHMFESHVQTLSDSPFMLLSTAGLWLYVRWLREDKGWPELAGLALVACCWVRVAGFPLVAPGRRGRKWGNAVALAVGAMATAGFFYWYYKTTVTGVNVPSYGHLISRTVGQSPWSLARQIVLGGYNGLRELSRIWTGQRIRPLAALALVAVPILAGMARSVRAGNRLIVCLSAVYYAGMVVAISSVRAPIARYFLPVAFLLILFWTDALDALMTHWAKSRPRLGRVAPYALAAMLAALTAVNLGKDVDLTYRIRHPDTLALYHGGDDVGIADMASFLAANLPEGRRFMSTDDPYELALYSGRAPLPAAKGLLRRDDAVELLREEITRNNVAVLIRFRKNNQSPWPQLFEQMKSQSLLREAHQNHRYVAYWVGPPASAPASAPAGGTTSAPHGESSTAR
jgi:hypothetical protein